MKRDPRITALIAALLTNSVLATPSTTAAADPFLRFCGNQGEAPCGSDERDFLNGPCDTGLERVAATCWRGDRGWIPDPCPTCKNDKRVRPEIDGFKHEWVDWALRNQRESLAYDEPINWVMHLGTHNSYNSISDGHAAFPNQFFSMTDQLRSGARFLTLDIYWEGDSARLCHGGACRVPGIPGTGAFLNPPGMRYFADGIKEIRNWLRRNPNEIIVIHLENYVGDGLDGPPGAVVKPLREYFGDWIYSAAQGPQQGSDFWPSRRQLLAMGKRVIIISSAPQSELEFHQALFVSGPFGTWFASRQDFDQCRGKDPELNLGGPSEAQNGQFSVVVENRGLDLAVVGDLDATNVTKAVACNYSAIALDNFSEELRATDRHTGIADFSRQKAAVWSWIEGDRGQYGNRAKMFLGIAPPSLQPPFYSYFFSAGEREVHRFACSRRRSESGADPAQWNMLESDWRITTRAGPWSEGQRICEEEFGTNYVFSVPVNGFQNKSLANIVFQRFQNNQTAEVWLNYADLRTNGQWSIPKRVDPRVGAAIRAVYADAGPDQLVECGALITLDGSRSTGINVTNLNYRWTGPFGIHLGAVFHTMLPIGEHFVELTVDDGLVLTNTDHLTITVSNSIAPLMTVTLSQTELWPPNHQLVRITADVRAQGGCNEEVVSVVLKSVVSNEPESGQGDGNNAPDIHDAEIGAGDIEFWLRAERSGRGTGRIYTVTYEASDLSGNVTEASARVIAPLNQGGRGGRGK